MTQSHSPRTRRGVIAGALLATVAESAISMSARAAPATGLTGHEHDWDGLVGQWNVRHRRLKARLVGSAEWEEFAGTSVLWLTLGRLGNVDDNVLELPSGTYRAMTVRAFDAVSGQWLIWWFDGRNPAQIDPPVRGDFKGGVGTFLADDTLNGRPIKVRFRWSGIAGASPRWEQAFSPDGGATWEVNWTMDFTRVRA